MKKTPIVAALATLFLASGCIVVADGGGGGGTATGDLTIFPTFAGSPCDVAGVSDIDIQIDGVTTTDHDLKHFACASTPADGGWTIKDFVEGDYDVTVTGYVGSAARYVMASPKRVHVNANADNAYEVDVPGDFGTLSVYWPSFGGASCTQAGLASVRATLLDASATTTLDDHTYDCSAGGVTWDFLDAGHYVVWLDGADSEGNVIWQATVNVTVSLGAANDYDATFEEVAGSLSVYWTFGGSGACGSVDSVHVTALDPWGNVFDDTSYDCTFGGVTYDVARAGSWTFALDGLDASGRHIYQSNEQTITVVAGQSNDYTIDLYGI